MKKLLIFCFLAFGFNVQANGPGYQVGDIVSDFKLKNINGKMVSLSDYSSSKGFLVVFTCNTCPVSKAYESRIIALNNKYSAKGYPLIAINPNDANAQPGDSFEKMQSYAKAKKFNFPYLYDPGHVVTKQFGATRTPHVFLIKKTDAGNVVEYIGAIDDDTENSNPEKTTYAENALDAVLAGNKPEVTFTKAVGCTIKWKKTQG